MKELEYSAILRALKLGSNASFMTPSSEEPSLSPLTCCSPLPCCLSILVTSVQG